VETQQFTEAEKNAVLDDIRRKPFDVPYFLARRLLLILIIGLPLFLIGSYVMLKHQGVYSADTTLMIIPTVNPKAPMDIMMEAGADFFRDTVLNKLSNDDFLMIALGKIKPTDRPPFLRERDEQKNVKSLRRHLVVQSKSGTLTVNIKLTDGSSMELATTLNSIVQTLMAVLKSEEERLYAERISYLHKKADFLLQEIQKTQEKIFHQSLDEKKELAAQQQEYLQTEKIKDAILLTMQKRMILRESLVGLAPENPDRASIEKNIGDLDATIDDFNKKYSSTDERNLSADRSFQLDQDVVNSGVATNIVSPQEAGNSTIKKDDPNLPTLQDGAVGNLSLSVSEGIKTMDVLRAQFGLISAKIDELEIQSSLPLPMTVDQVAETPKISSGTIIKTTSRVFLLVFGLVTMVFFMIDFRDQKIRTPHDLGAALGVEDSLVIPATLENGGEDTEFGAKLNPPTSFPASVAVADLALKMIRDHELNGSKVFSFMGLNPRSGGTSIALNVARYISGRGFCTLLVELPHARPGLADSAAISREIAPVNYGWGEKYTEPVTDVRIIPWTPKLSEEEVRKTFKSFIKGATAKYDFVLMDLPDIATSDTSREAALKSDVAVIIASQGVTEFADAKEAVEWVTKGGVPAVTTVLNFYKA
jgi:hypothetical protein